MTASAVIATPPFLAFFDLNGAPLSGGKIYTYAAGTSTPKVTYTDEGALTPMPNPIILDSAGRATWWLIGSYRYQIYDALGNLIATTDNVTAFTTLADAADAYFQSFSGDGTTTVFTTSSDLGTEEKALMVFVNNGLVSDIANGTFASDTIWTKGAGWTIGAGVATATGAISTAISQTATQTLVQGQAYSVTYTITQSAGGLIPSIGDQAGTIRSTAGTYMETIVAGATQTIAFTGSGFTGTLDNVTVNIASGPGFEIQNPSAYTISGTSLTFATAPATGTNNIYVFAPSLLLGAASSAASQAIASAAAALTSETNSATSATASAASATTSASSATASASSATTATTQASNASTSATNASTSETNSATSATASASAATAAAASAVSAGSTLTATSTTSNTVGTGNFTFTTQANKNFIAGQPIIASSAAAPTSYIHGYVASYSGTSLVITETDNGGSGSHADWNIAASGLQGPSGGGTGTVTTVSVATANGFSGTVANATTTPAITIIAGAIAPTSVNTVVLSGSSTPTLAVTGTTTVSGSNTGDQTISDATITTTDITTNNVSTSKHGFAPKAPNDATKFLDGTGAYSVPASSGKMYLLDTQTASNSTALAFTSDITSSYDLYFFQYVDIKLISASQDLLAQYSNNNGSTYLNSGNNYGNVILGGATLLTSSTAISFAQINGNGLYLTGGAADCGNGTNSVINGSSYLYNPNSTTGEKLMKNSIGYINGTGQVYKDTVGIYGVNGATGYTAVNAIKFLATSGNISSGKILMYGIKNS